MARQALGQSPAASPGRQTCRARESRARVADLFDRLVRRTVLPESDRVVREDVEHGQASSTRRAGSRGACSPRRSGRSRRTAASPPCRAMPLSAAPIACSRERPSARCGPSWLHSAANQSPCRAGPNCWKARGRPTAADQLGHAAVPSSREHLTARPCGSPPGLVQVREVSARSASQPSGSCSSSVCTRCRLHGLFGKRTLAVVHEGTVPLARSAPRRDLDSLQPEARGRRSGTSNAPSADGQPSASRVAANTSSCSQRRAVRRPPCPACSGCRTRSRVLMQIRLGRSSSALAASIASSSACRSLPSSTLEHLPTARGVAGRDVLAERECGARLRS